MPSITNKEFEEYQKMKEQYPKMKQALMELRAKIHPKNGALVALIESALPGKVEMERVIVPLYYCVSCGWAGKDKPCGCANPQYTETKTSFMREKGA